MHCKCKFVAILGQMIAGKENVYKEKMKNEI